MPDHLTTRLLLIRHAESLANAARRVQGSGDDPLSPCGEAQAHQLARWLRTTGPHIDTLFSSPLQRACQTAAAISAALELPVQLRPGLREMDLGKLEGVDEATWNAALKVEKSVIDRGGETPTDFVERVLGTLHGLLAVNQGKTVLVVTHGGVISTALAYWIAGNVLHWQRYAMIQNTAMSEVLFGKQIALVRINDTAHLSEERMPNF